MTDLVLLGAGGHAREILDIVFAANVGEARIRLVGLIDERLDMRGRRISGVPILGDFDWFKENDYQGTVITAVGDVALRERFVQRASELGLSFARVISPQAQVSGSAELGTGIVVFPHVFISSQVSLGNHCHCNVGSSVSHDSQIGDYATLAPGATITGRVTVGRGAAVGANSTLLPDAKVGEYSIIAAGAVVTGAIDPYSVAVGAPAKIVRKITRDLPDPLGNSSG